MTEDNGPLDEGDSAGINDISAETADLVEQVKQNEQLRDQHREELLELSERPRGILSEADRKYLSGLKEYKHKQSESNRKQAIRVRTAHAIHDFLLLSRLLEKEEREKIFNEEIGEEDLQFFLQSMISFIYVGLDQDETRLEEIIKKGIYNGANLDKTGRWSGKATDVYVHIDIEYEADIDKLYKKLQEGKENQLTPGEIGVLVQSGRLDTDDFKKLTETDPKTQDRFPTSIDEFLSS